MTTITLPFLNSYKDRHGKIRFYFRRAGFKRVSLPGGVGSARFMDAYRDALAGKIEVGAGRSLAGTVGAVIAGYYGSMSFANLATGTQKERRRILEAFRSEHGSKRISMLRREHIELLASTKSPAAAHNFLVAVRSLLAYAVTTKIIRENPAADIAKPKQRGDGIYTWSEDDVAKFEARYPIGTRESLALALLLYTAQRRSDVVCMGPQHIRDGVIHVRQKKTGVMLAIPIHPELQRILEATPTKHLTFLVTRTGRPFSPSDFSHWMKDKIREVGLCEEASVHGLRKAACRRLAEAGCSASIIQAISGHMSLREVERYTRAASQESMAAQGIASLTKGNKKRRKG